MNEGGEYPTHECLDRPFTNLVISAFTLNLSCSHLLVQLLRQEHKKGLKYGRAQLFEYVRGLVQEIVIVGVDIPIYVVYTCIS